MENPLKQFLYAGIGLASLTTEKVQSTLDELVEKGKISDSEAKKVAEDVIANLNGKREDFEDKLGDVVKNVAEKLNYVKREDYENLQKRVKDLESELAKSKTAKTAATK
jgi:polyhydroxyalkanoate synthesis regulator phasin